jgi:hypothetical protein
MSCIAAYSHGYRFWISAGQNIELHLDRRWGQSLLCHYATVSACHPKNGGNKYRGTARRELPPDLNSVSNNRKTPKVDLDEYSEALRGLER